MIKDRFVYELDLFSVLDQFRLSLCYGASFVTAFDVELLQNRLMNLYDKHNEFNQDVHDQDIIDSIMDKDHPGG